MSTMEQAEELTPKEGTSEEASDVEAEEEEAETQEEWEDGKDLTTMSC